MPFLKKKECFIKSEVTWKEKHKYFRTMQHSAMKLCKWTFHWFSISPLSLSLSLQIVYVYLLVEMTMMMISNCQMNPFQQQKSEWVTCWKEFVVFFIELDSSIVCVRVYMKPASEWGKKCLTAKNYRLRKQSRWVICKQDMSSKVISGFFFSSLCLSKTRFALEIVW
jgi:hypothetical protein